MIDWKSPETFALIIAITEGFIIPAMLGLFGWLEKVMRENVTSNSENGLFMEIVMFHLKKYPEMSSRETAALIARNYMITRQYRKEKN